MIQFVPVSSYTVFFFLATGGGLQTSCSAAHQNFEPDYRSTVTVSNDYKPVPKNRAGILRSVETNSGSGNRPIQPIRPPEWRQ